VRHQNSKESSFSVTLYHHKLNSESQNYDLVPPVKAFDSHTYLAVSQSGDLAVKRLNDLQTRAACEESLEYLVTSREQHPIPKPLCITAATRVTQLCKWKEKDSIEREY